MCRVGSVGNDVINCIKCDNVKCGRRWSRWPHGMCVHHSQRVGVLGVGTLFGRQLGNRHHYTSTVGLAHRRQETSPIRALFLPKSGGHKYRTNLVSTTHKQRSNIAEGREALNTQTRMQLTHTYNIICAQMLVPVGRHTTLKVTPASEVRWKSVEKQVRQRRG